MIRFLVVIFVAAMIPLSTSAQDGSPSPFEFHGIVEGFYGTPWNHEERLEMVRFMGEVGFNTFFYAPKDDPYHRSRWREPYPDAELDRFRELFRETEQANVTLYYAISPGLSIEYSSDDDFRALIDKIDAMMEQGVRHFALFVDDVPEELAHAADQERFANLGEAHVYLINRLYADLQQRGADLIVCPTTYTDAWGDREYIRILGEGIPQEIPLFWTGTDVVVERITADEARNWGRIMSRRPLIWDNFPVNDYDAWRPYIGPLRGRSPELADVTRGLIANPMVEPYLSMIPLYTVAEFVRNPYEYDPDAAWSRAIADLYGRDAAAELEPVLRLYDDFGWDHNLFRSLYAPGNPIRIGEIEDSLALITETVGFLRNPPYEENVRLQGALDELEKFRRATEERIAALRAMEGYRETSGEDGLLLVFDEDMDRFVANRARNVNPSDGRLCDWTGFAFHSLQGNGDAHAAFQYDDDHLYIAVDVRDDDLRPSGAHTIYDGDHVALAVDYSPSDTARHLTSGDVLLQLTAPEAEDEFQSMLTTMDMTEHAARGATDLHRSRLSHFFQFFAVDPPDEYSERFADVRYAVHPSDNGYVVEVALPREGRNEIRLDIGYFDVNEADGQRSTASGTLSRRGYLFNPKAYATVEMP